MLHYYTAAAISFAAFLAGLVTMGVIRNERFIRMAAKLAAATTKTDQQASEILGLKRQLHDVRFVLEMKAAECKKLRERMRGGLSVVRGDEPKGVA